MKDVFLSWLGGVRPDLLPRYAEVCSKGSESSPRYHDWLAGRILLIIAAHGLPAPDEAIEDQFALNGQTSLAEPSSDQHSLFLNTGLTAGRRAPPP